jgi:hypothetical protein
VRQALDAGAVAAVMGTRFLLSEESRAHPDYKLRLHPACGIVAPMSDWLSFWNAERRRLARLEEPFTHIYIEYGEGKGIRPSDRQHPPDRGRRARAFRSLGGKTTRRQRPSNRDHCVIVDSRS